MDITEDVVELVMRKLLGGLALKVRTSKLYMWLLLKFGEDRKKLCTGVGIFVDWLANQSPTWSSYREFFSAT